MTSGLAAVGAVPDVNDLVKVIPGVIDNSSDAPRAPGVPSRVEDVVRAAKSGKVVEYVIAEPWFSGKLARPAQGAEFLLVWPTPRGMCMLPVAFLERETSPHKPQVWRVRVTGAPGREERRQFVRVPWSLPTELEVRSDLDTLEPDARRLVELGGLQAAIAELPPKIEAVALNVSEGGLLCRSQKPALPTYLPLMARFTIDVINFEIGCSVVWSLLRKKDDLTFVESALVFDRPGENGDVLRPLLFQAQLRDRRAARS